MTNTEMVMIAKTKKGHISNVRLFDYLDEARKEWYQFCIMNGVEAVVVHIGVNYKKEVYNNDKLFICTSLERIGNTSFTLQQSIENEKEVLLVAAETVMATIDRVTRTKVAVPDEVRCLLKEDGHLNINKVVAKKKR